MVYFKYLKFMLFHIFLLKPVLFALTLNESNVNFVESMHHDGTDIDHELTNDKTIIIKFATPLSESDKKSYYDNGVKSIVYAGNLSYYFYADKQTIDDINQTNHMLGFSEFEIVQKASKEILDHNISEYARDQDGNYLFNVLLLKSYEIEKLRLIFDDVNADIVSFEKDKNNIEIKIAPNQLEELLKLPIIKHIEEKNPPLMLLDHPKRTRNLHASNLINTSPLWNAPYSLSGEDVKVAVVDGGQIRTTHQEFQKNSSSRVTIMGNNNNLSSHATHVGGTIGAFGIEPTARGMANNTLLYSYYYNDKAFAVSIEQAYNDESILLSNHSYGYMFKVYLGKYNTAAQAMDNSIYNNPYLNAFMAAGNDRDNAGYDNYGIIKGPPNAKNVFTVGAISDDGNTLADFSSTGPVKDGRIKPDLVANGTSLYSTDSASDNSYTLKDGTSMATPSATGAAALLMEQYKLETGSEIKHHTLKSIMINSAIDKGRYGPDYEYGYGLIDAKAAVDIIKTINADNSLITEESIKHDQNRSYCFHNAQISDYKATISWIDPPGNPAYQDKTLVNDVDIWLEDESGAKYFPFSLDKDNPESVATSNDYNRVDNVEQIFISNLPVGEYKLYIRGFEVISSSQEFAVISSTSFDSIPNAPSNLKVISVNSSFELSWDDNSDNESGFKIYKNGSLIHTATDNETNYIDIGANISGSYKYEVRATNCAGDSSVVSYTKVVEGSRGYPPFPPYDFQEINTTHSCVTLIWRDLSNDESGFQIQRDSSTIHVTDENVTLYTDCGLTPSTTYTCDKKSPNLMLV